QVCSLRLRGRCGAVAGKTLEGESAAGVLGLVPAGRDRPVVRRGLVHPPHRQEQELTHFFLPSPRWGGGEGVRGTEDTPPPPTLSPAGRGEKAERRAMICIPWFGPDDYLLLTPRWEDLGPAAQGVLLALVFLVPLALVLWLYRYEMRLVPRARAFALLFLRLLVLLVPVTLVSLRPRLTHETHPELPGRVMVAVDLSDSMDLRDPQREPVEKLRLAKALQLAGGLASNAQLEEWIKQYEAKRPIQWVKPDEFPDDPQRREKEE